MGARSWILLFLIGGVGLMAQRGWNMDANAEPPAEFLPKNPAHEYSFTRLVYHSEGPRYGWPFGWTTDYPKADFQFMMGVKRLSRIDAQDAPVTMKLDHPRLFQYPFLYAVETGFLVFSESEAARMREYLLRGGFFMADDFHGDFEWQHFEKEIHKVFPDREIVDLPISHPIFQCVFNIPDKMQVPGAQYLQSGRTWEKGGYTALYRAILDDQGRVMVMINHNVDLGDAWEWADVPQYEERYTTRAYHLGINYITYSMTH